MDRRWRRNCAHFFSLRNLEIVATIFVLVVAVQAVPVADGAVDIALFSLALAQFGWSGVLTLRDLIAAVVMAARAKNRATIDAAAEKAAQALVSLGVTALLAAVVKRFSPSYSRHVRDSLAGMV